ncbi:MAG: zinc transporter ZntB [Gammaproteobacteria bacterium]|jgi:zinc transporter|nr:zinc transporter ZntB [Gammaproteobacteria bacterium]
MTNFPSPKGLCHAWLLDGEGGGAQLDWDKVEGWQPDQGCLWLHLDFEDREVDEWLRDHSGLAEIAIDALLSSETRPRTQNLRDELLLALRGVNLNPGSDPEDMVSIRLWTDGHRVISTRRRPLLSTQDVLERIEAGNGAVDAAELIVDLIERIVMRMSDTVENLEDEVMVLEERVLSTTPAALRYELALLRKQTIAIRRYLAPQREALNRLVMEKFSWLGDTNLLRVREINDRLIRHIEDIDVVRERAALAQEELLSRISEQINERMYVLSIVAAVFLPLGFFTGLMGINVGGMPGVNDGDAFWWVVALCVGIMFFLGVIFRWKKWL